MPEFGKLTMVQFLEFVGNHWALSSMWLITIGALIFYYQRTTSKAVGPQAAVMLINRSDGVVVDVRDKKEFESGHIVESINIPLIKLEQRITELNKHKEKPVIIVCKMGHQSTDACSKLQQAGFSQVVKLAGGLAEWKAQSLPLIQK